MVHGQKVWTSTAQVASKDHASDAHHASTRTASARPTASPSSTPTSTAEDRGAPHPQDGPQGGRFQRDLHRRTCSSPTKHRIGEEGKGFGYILHSLNPERILVGTEAIAIGRDALAPRRSYAKERVVFGRPIGQNQGIQHPLAEKWMYLESAWLMVMKAARTLRQRQALRRRGQRRQVPRLRAPATTPACRRC
jgi:acyl-CoA dehydrogenase